MKKTGRPHKFLILGLAIFGIISVSCAVFGPREPALQKNFLWELRSEKSVVYLLGAIPVKSLRVYPLKGIIEDAFEESDTLVVETDNFNTKPAKTWAALTFGGVYHKHGSLSGHLKEDVFRVLNQALDELDIPFESMDRFKPWYVAMKIREAVFKDFKYLPENQMEYYFLEKAGEHKHIVELEGIREKVGFLNSLSRDAQEDFFMATIWELQLIEKSAPEIFSAWTWGDSEGMDAIFSRIGEDDRNGGRSFRELLHRRNQRFLQKIEGFLAKEGSYFVLVGAPHLAGEKGIVNLLVEKGYTLQQL